MPLWERAVPALPHVADIVRVSGWRRADTVRRMTDATRRGTRHDLDRTRGARCPPYAARPRFQSEPGRQNFFSAPPNSGMYFSHPRRRVAPK